MIRRDREGRWDDRSETSPVETARAEISGRDLCRHLALFYESVDSQLTVSSAFVKNELERGRRVIYLYDENAPTDIKAALAVADVDVERRIAANDLEILDAESVYLDEGFDPDRMIETLADKTQRAMDDGYSGLSAAGENTWCFHTDLSFDHVLEFESKFDARVPDLPITTLCQYNLERFDQRSIAKALWTHEQIVYRHRVCDNPYYVPPGEYRFAETDGLDSRLMLEQAYTLSEAHRDIERREERLSVLNRVLRHDIRNELNIVLGNLSETMADDCDDAELRTRIETAQRYTESVIETAEKAQYVETTMTNDTTELLELRDVVDDAVQRISDRFPAARISVSGDRRLTVLADSNIEEALVELLNNAIQHQERDPPQVAVSLEERDHRIGLEVHNPGTAIPADDQLALESGRETPLVHGSGLGLWMVKWIAENSRGSLSFPEREGQCVIRLELPKVEN